LPLLYTFYGKLDADIGFSASCNPENLGYDSFFETSSKEFVQGFAAGRQ